MTPTRDILDRAWPHILAAPKDGAAISYLCIRPERNTRRFVDELHLSAEQGVSGDPRWLSEPWLKTEEGTGHPGIQVCVLSRRVLDLVWNDDGIFPGDTFIVDMNLTMENVPTGTRLAVGTAVLEVSDVFNEGCVKWKARYGVDAYDWARDPANRHLRPRGILCSIVQDGFIRTGDRLFKQQ